MDLMKYMLNQAKGHPSGDLSAMLDGGAGARATSQNLGVSPSVDIPLSVRMQHKKIPYSSWPKKAKDELTPEMRAAYERDLQKQSPGLFAGPSTSDIGEASMQMGVDGMKEAMLKQAAETSLREGNPYLQTGIDAQNMRKDQGIMPTDGARGAGEVNEWMDAYTSLLVAVRRGQMTEEQAHAQLAPVLASSGIAPDRNPFAKQNSSLGGQ